MPEKLLLSPELKADYRANNLKDPCKTQGSLIKDNPETNNKSHFVAVNVEQHPRGYKLPSLPLTPIDDETGLPWCIIPSGDLPAVLSRHQKNYARRADWNHIYPRVEVLHGSNPLFDNNRKARLALLNLRWQWLTYEDHHLNYNNNFIGPYQPSTHQQLGITAVMGLAGFIPEYGIKFRNNKPYEHKLREDERRFLWSSGQVRIGHEFDVLQYLTEYIFNQEVDHIREREIDEFLHTFDITKRIYLGYCLTVKIIERAIEPVEDIYTLARRRGYLYPMKGVANKTGVPVHPSELIKLKILRKKGSGIVFNELSKKLGQYNRQLKSNNFDRVA